MLPSEGSKEAGTASRTLVIKKDLRKIQTPNVDFSTLPSEIDTLKNKYKEKGLLTAEDIKQSKDRINALRNIFPFYSHVKHNRVKGKDSAENTEEFKDVFHKSDQNSLISKEKLCSEQDEEKDTCDKSDSESIQSVSESRSASIVHSRIASYESCESNPRLNVIQASSNDILPSVSKGKTLDDSWRYTKPSKGRLNALKDKYQSSVTNFAYDGCSFGSKDENSGLGMDQIPSHISKTKKTNSEYLEDPSTSSIINTQDNLIYRLQSEIDNLEARNKGDHLSNVIIGNKDVLKLLSNKHLANLNIRVEKNNDFRRDNRWRENLGSFKAAKSGIRTSLRSSTRKKKQTKYRTGNNYNSFEEKGTSDSTLKENESESDDGLYKKICEPTCQISEAKDWHSKYSTGDFVKKKFPEYAKVNKRKGLIVQKETDALPRSLSTSPIERAPVVKKICSSSSKLKKDTEPSLMVNPVKKVDSFRGSRVTRRNSFLYNTRGKTAKEGFDQESFVKTQAVRLRRKDSRNSKQSEYRVSVTIRPSTVANLANKFNTIILQNQPGNATLQSSVPFGKVSVTESKVPKYYSSPRASFKRKYRHRSSKATKELKAKELAKVITETVVDSTGIDNSIYYTENIAVVTRRSLNNSLSELNMKDLFEDSDYNKTDEEKVCEKLKTALSSAKFKGETDDSEDDLSSKAVKLEDVVVSETYDERDENELDDLNLSVHLCQKSSHSNDVSILDVSDNANNLESKKESDNGREGHFKSDSIDSGISADEERLKEIREDKRSTKQENGKISIKTDNDDSGVFGSFVQEDSKYLSVIENSEISQDCEKKALTTTENNNELLEAANEVVADDIENVPLLSCEEEVFLEPISIIAVVKESAAKELDLSEMEVSGSAAIPDEIDLGSSNLKDDSYSEVSSVCSDMKGKKPKDDIGIYTSLKTVVKNTVKKNKEKETGLKEDRDKKRPSPSQERNKWYNKGKSKERKALATEDDENKLSCEGPQEKKDKDGKLYEKWTFKRKNREKSKERKPRDKSKEKKHRDKSKERKPRDKSKERKPRDKSKERRLKDKSKERKPNENGKEKKSTEKNEEGKSSDRSSEESKESICQENCDQNIGNRKLVNENERGSYEDSKRTDAASDTDDDRHYYNATDSDLYQDFPSDDNSKESLYGKLKFASRSRGREKRLAKKMSRVEMRKLNTLTETIKEEEQPKQDKESIQTITEEGGCIENEKKPDAESKTEDFVIYEPQIPSAIKFLPPPPKTPVPSPPNTFLRMFIKNKSKYTSKKEIDSSSNEDSAVTLDSSDTTENIYENLYSPDMTKLKRNREKLEGRGIKPNSSFLWSGTAVVSTPATLTKAILDQVPATNRDIAIDKNDMMLYGKFRSPIAKISSEDSSSDGHNYTEIQSNSNGDSQTIAYDDIGTASAVSYDEIAAPSSCGYDDIRPPSLPDEYDHYKTCSEGYDPVNPPRSDSSQYDECNGGVVTAQLSVVRTEHIDSLSYVYDDVSMYNTSIASHSYEPVCPPDPVISLIEEQPEKENASLGEIMTPLEAQRVQDYGDSEYGPHEVFSYKLTRVCKGSPMASTRVTSLPSYPNEVCESSRPSTASQTSLFKLRAGEESHDEKIASSYSVRSKQKHKQVHRHSRDKEPNHWEDVTDSEEEEIPVTLTTRIPFVRKPNLKRVARYRVNKKSWTQGVRDVAAHNRVPHIRSTNLAKVHPHQARTHITHTRSHTHIRTNTDHVITYSWRQKRGESDNEESTTGHYEAIYEVISPADEKVADEVPEGEIGFGEDLTGPLDDDSFDSDESDEAYSRLQPQYFDDKDAVTLRERVESFSSDISGEKCETYLRHKYNRSQSHQPHSMNKLAEAANLGMKRLRRNWSVTKNEVRTGLSKIKKKSAFNMVEAKSTEDILSEMSSSQSEKAKWSFKSHFRRKSSGAILPLSLCNDEKDKATFYLTLTIASDGQETENRPQTSSSKGYTSDERLCSNLERRKSNTPSVSSVATTTSCDTSVSSRSRPLSMPGTALLRNTSSGSTSGALLRPTTAPPAPPNDGEEEEYQREISKEALACRLNQILSAGPVAPPGRRILRTSDCSSPEMSPVPLLIPPEDKLSPPHINPQNKYSLPQLPNAQLPHRFSSSLSLTSEIANSIKSNVPQARLSVASSTSSHGYIRASDIASSPPPLPARPISITGNNNTLSRLSNLSQSHPNISAPIMISGTSDIDSRSYLDLTYDAHLVDEPPYMSSHFADEPLYQFYTAKVERAALYQGDSSEDDYEVINDGGLGQFKSIEAPTRPTAMELVTPTDGRRTLWCELPEVINSGILAKISSQERKVQEAIFEVVTSEASYLKSLEVLVNHFMNCPEFVRIEDPVITARERNVLFSDIIQVKKCSELFLADLEKRWQESFIISRITDIIHTHSSSSFNVYIKYCSNQIYQDRKLRDLKENNPRFMEVLNRLESAPICQSLAMHSFLMLPMQRITRLPLLVDAIFNRLEYASSQWEECKTALASLQKIVAECNEGARKMERMEEMLLISHQLDFREVRAIPLISASRWLVKKGELTRLTWKEGDAKLTFGRKISKHSLYFFLFTDLLVVTKKKSDDQHMVLDYCPRNMVQVLELESADKFPGRLLDGHKNLIIMTMLQNHENKTVEMVLSCPLESDRSRWMEGVTPRISENPDERIYEEWDCPQVQVVHPYISTQPDELTLEVSDVFNVLKKTSDGWYQGERLRDGSRGWFPGNHTVEIASAHVRARNLRQRYRLLAISGSIVDEIKKKEKCEKEEKKKERRRTITIKEIL